MEFLMEPATVEMFAHAAKGLYGDQVRWLGGMMGGCMWIRWKSDGVGAEDSEFDGTDQELVGSVV